MAKDYAKRVFTTRQAPQKNKRRMEASLIPAIGIIFLSIFFAIAIKMNHTTQGSLVEKVKSYFAAKKASPKSTPVLAQGADIHHNQAQPVHFDFYSTLPNIKANQPQVQPTVAAPPVAPATSAAPQYIVELGVFKTETEASQTRLSLLLAGFEANVVKVKSATGDVYRIQRGPFSSPLEAKKVQKKLLNKGIAGDVKKL